MQKVKTAYIGLGSNLGDRQKSIRSALEIITQTPELQVVAATDPVATRPLGRREQPDYLNAVAQISTTLDPETLLKKLNDIETTLGRDRQQKWASRSIDLDLLLYEDQIVDLPDLTIPHPQMHLRSFVLNAVCSLNDKLIHPRLNERITELAARLRGGDFILNPDVPQLVAVAGNIGVGKTTLTEKLAEVLGCKPIFEAYDKNPFLPDVYAGKTELALDSQLYFLTSRLEQLGLGVLESGKIAVSDYIFEKELIYARQLLTERQLILYEKIFQLLSAKVIGPVVVIYLHDLPTNCLERIKKRNRPYEQTIQLDLLHQLDCQYRRLFQNWKSSPVITLDMSQFDAKRNDDVKNLTNQVNSYTAKSWK